MQTTVVDLLVGATVKMTEKDTNCNINQTGEQENIGITGRFTFQEIMR